MLLQQTAHFNDLSPKLREELEKKIEGFGKHVRYKFDISHSNPDPTFHNGKILWPNMYTLDPTVWNIVDKYEDRKDKQKSKRIALVDGVDEKGLPNKYRKIRMHERQKGILVLDLLENPEHIDIAMAIELHPKLTGGMFSDVTKKQVITRIDEQATAKKERAERSAKSKARRAAEEFDSKGVVNFADAMLWDSTEDELILRNQIEELAETNPEFFNDLVEGKMIEYQSAVKQALDRKIIAFDPAEYKFTWTGNFQTIVMLNNIGEKTEIQKMADWLQSGGAKEKAVYDKIKAMIKDKSLV